MEEILLRKLIEKNYFKVTTEVDARARGNLVTLSGPPATVALARRVLESLYDRLLEGHDVLQGDVEGAVRMAEVEDAQLQLPTLDESSRMRLARIATRKKSVVARTPMQDAYIRAMDRCELVFGLVLGIVGKGRRRNHNGDEHDVAGAEHVLSFSGLADFGELRQAED